MKVALNTLPKLSEKIAYHRVYETIKRARVSENFYFRIGNVFYEKLKFRDSFSLS